MLFRFERDGAGEQAGGRGGDCARAGRGVVLRYHEGFAIEGAARVGFERLVGYGAAVVDAGIESGAVDGECDFIVGPRAEVAVGVDYLGGDVAQVGAVGRYGRAVGVRRMAWGAPAVRISRRATSRPSLRLTAVSVPGSKRVRHMAWRRSASWPICL